MSKRLQLVIKFSIVGFAVGVAAWLCLTEPFMTPADMPADMPAAAPQRCVAVFVICIALWFTSIIPMAATGLLAIALLPLLNVLPEEKALGLFGNTAVFFMLGVFLLSGAMIATGLSKRLTLVALQRFDRSPNRLISGVLLSSAFLSMWMPAYGVAAMIYPIVDEIVSILKLPRGHPYAKKLFLALAWGAVIGACGTVLGGARAPLALSLLSARFPEKSITFVQWMIASMPVVVVMTSIALLLLRRRMPNGIDDIRAATRMLDERVAHLGPMSGRERRLTALGLMTIVAWIVAGDAIGLVVIAILSAVLLFLFRIVAWQGVQGYVNWGVLIMYGGAVALGKALTETQAMTWMAAQVIDENAPRLVVLLSMIAVTMILTEGISNAAAVAILLPIGYSLCETTGIGPVMVTFAVTVPAGMSFLLPISSPPNAISLSAGHYGVREVLMRGWPLSLAALLVLSTVLVVWWDWVLDIGQW